MQAECTIELDLNLLLPRGGLPPSGKRPEGVKNTNRVAENPLFFLEDGFFFYNLELQNWQFQKSVKDCVPLLFLMNVPIPSSKMMKKSFFSLIFDEKNFFFTDF